MFWSGEPDSPLTKPESPGLAVVRQGEKANFSVVPALRSLTYYWMPVASLSVAVSFVLAAFPPEGAASPRPIVAESASI